MAVQGWPAVEDGWEPCASGAPVSPPHLPRLRSTSPLCGVHSDEPTCTRANHTCPSLLHTTILLTGVIARRTSRATSACASARNPGRPPGRSDYGQREERL